jgi:hypothetical protein
MSLDLRALISAHAEEASALYEAHVDPRLAQAPRLMLCGLLAQERKRRCDRGLERVYCGSTGSEATETATSSGSSPQRKATD